MLSVITYAKVGLRIATMLGFISSGVSLVGALVYLVTKLINYPTMDLMRIP